MALDRPAQYATDVHLRARQRLWEQQRPRFDLVGWVLDLAGLSSRSPAVVLDIGCGNGMYLSALERRGIRGAGCDLSFGMLESALPHPRLVNADATALPFAAESFDVVLAPHMLYHVDDRTAAATELRRVLRPRGRCVVVTNGANHIGSLRHLVEAAARRSTPEWEMRDPATQAFSLENGGAQLRAAFDHVECIRPRDAASVRLTDAKVAADYVASVGHHYEAQLDCPWRDIVDAVREAVQRRIDRDGAFVVAGDTGAFVCS